MAYEQPYLRVQCHPLSAVPLTVGRGWTVVDNIPKMLRSGGAEGITVGIDADLPSSLEIAAGAGGSHDGTLFGIDNLEFRRIDDEVDGTSVGGFQVRTRWVPRNSFLADATGTPDDVAFPSTLYRCVGWTPEPLGQGSWRTCRADEHDHTGITWHDGTAGQAFAARTLQALPAQQGFACRLRVWPSAASKDAKDASQVYLTWGNNQWALSAKPRSRPVLLRSVAGTWQVAREFPQGAMGGWFEGEEVWVYNEFIGGRMVTSVRGPGGGHQVAYSRRPADSAGDQRPTLLPVNATAGHLRIAGMGCTCVAEVYEPRHNQLDSDGRYHRVGSFSREYWAPISPAYSKGEMADGMTAMATGYGAENRPGYATPDGPAALPTEIAKFQDVKVRGNRRRYTCTLQSEFKYSKGGEIGADDGTDWHNVGTRNPVQAGGEWSGVYHNDWWRSQSPLVTSASISYASRYSAPDAETPLDIRPALLSARHSTADPGISPTRSFSADIDLDVLPECSLVGSTTPIGDLWPNYVGRHHPIFVVASWFDAESNKGAWYSKTDSTVDEVLMLYGYQTGWRPGLQGYGEGRAQLEASDPTIRLLKPAGIVDDRYKPLDLILAAKARANGGRPELYGWEAVQYIIEGTVGPEPVRYYKYPPGWHGLLAYEVFTNPPQGNGFLWAPPYGSDALSWIRQIADRDFAVFFMDRHYDEGTWYFMPHYGNYMKFIANGPAYTVSDVVNVVPWDYNTVLQGLDAAERAELDVNRMLVWGRIPGDSDPTGGGLWPARPAQSGEGRIEFSTVAGQGISETWERTKVVDGPHFYWPGVAQCVADWVMWLIRDTRMRSATLKMRGQPGFCWGDKITLDLSHPRSQDELELNGQSFRIAKLDHEWQFGQAVEYTTTAVCTPLKSLPTYVDTLHLIPAGSYY